MSTASETELPVAAPHGHAHGEHDPHLAHHFDTPDQQMTSAKLGMWVFLGTEVLMFGGLFCAYSINRHNHPLVFSFAAESYLNVFWGTLNTLVLITSSLTMAWGVRAAQLNQKRLLIVCLILTLIGAAGFMVIKGIEYSAKWREDVWVGQWNKYNALYKGAEPQTPASPMVPPAATAAAAASPATPSDANSGQDVSMIKPRYEGPSGLASETSQQAEASRQSLQNPRVIDERYHDLSDPEQWHVNVFFSCYFLMTGLHGLHVLIGMGVITWLLIRAVRGEFSASYFTPVDLVGLYWHLVDIIWIFLYPLLYLIH
jgi:cytochrome c oxidase subunit 3